MGELEGKAAMVTGASRGIGRAIALGLAEAGVDIVVNYRASEADAHAVRAQVERLGRRAVAVQADVSRAVDVRRLLDTARRELGPVAIVVNNAGLSRPQPLEEIREEDWDELLDVNLKSAFLVTQAALPDLRARRWGRVINIASVAAQVGGVVGPHYAASKAGMLGLTRAYAALLAGEGITVNAIAPALIETDMVRNNPRARRDLIPVGRFGTVDEVAAAALMLAGNGYITGQTINVNGGWFLS